MVKNYDAVSENNLSTVVAEYDRTLPRADSFQSEAELEADLLARLERQGYEYLPIHKEEDLIVNLRLQLEKLNDIRFTDGEWARFFASEIANAGKGIIEKTETIQRDNVKSFVRDSGETKNIYLLDTVNPHHNVTQVINQYEATAGKRPNRYDVTLLVNGFPLVHLELKRRGVNLKEAFNQINRYGRESFWAGSGLYEYVQIFIISNGTETKYYSNTTRDCHIREQAKTAKKPQQKTCNSFAFTSYWADAANKVINDLEDFTATFLSRHALLKILTRYCVFTEQKLLMVMRPYQIAASEALLNQIEIAHNARAYGSRAAGGYVWHTTGSGKTLTSFKTAQLACKLPYIDKVLFVVDRKDLDYQTMREYDRFQKGAANGSTSTKELQQRLEDPKSKIVITTIQKLTTFIKNNAKHPFYQKEVVMIFDECHRSQFGEMHAAITKRFKKYYLFGFTGTPIFIENITTGKGNLRTTEDVFGRRLHAYTIVDAIRDQNVLKFRVAYISTMKEQENVVDAKVYDIARDKALIDPRRITNISRYILEHFEQQTRRRENAYVFKNKRIRGFNSLFATQSIAFAKAYYTELQKQNAALPVNKRLKIATIFSYAPNEEVEVDGSLEENSENTEKMDKSSRDFLDSAISDYNALFRTNFDTSAEKFGNYYKDVSLRMKNREIDILIVVNMFLTGFDATTLNTLWVDKDLRYHGLLQAFSRTNRILNSVKTFGNIVCFRNLEDATNKCLALFGDVKAKGVTLLRSLSDYLYGYTDEKGMAVKGYITYINELKALLRPGQTPLSEQKKRDFIVLFGTILRYRNMLTCFDDFSKQDPLTQRDLQDYTSVYIKLAEERRVDRKGNAAEINDDVAFEMELVRQFEVSIDYILYLVKKIHEGIEEEKILEINKAVDSSPDLRDKKELINQFIASLTPNSDVTKEWLRYVREARHNEFKSLVKEESLKEEKTAAFLKSAFERGYVPEGGLQLNDLLPSIDPFDPQAGREAVLKRVLARLKDFFAKYYGLCI